METTELSPALHASAVNLDYLIGGVFVIMYAASRFNTRATNRSTTTWIRYHLAATMYLGVGLVLFGLLAAYRPFQTALRHTPRASAFLSRSLVYRLRRLTCARRRIAMKTIDTWHNGAAVILGWALLASTGCSTLDSPTAPTTTATSPAPNAASIERYDGPKASLAVAAFAIKAPKAKDVSGDGLADMLATALFESNRFIVLERQALPALAAEQKLGASGGKSPSAAPGNGQIEGADLLVIGAVTEFEPGAAGAKASASDRGASTNNPSGGNKKAGSATISKILDGAIGSVAMSHVAIDLRVVDARTSRVVAATRVEGKATDLDLSGLGKLAGSNLGVGLSVYARTPMEKAIRLAIREAVQFVGSKTPSEYYHYRDTSDGVVASKGHTPGRWHVVTPPPVSEPTARPPANPSEATPAPVKVLYIMATDANVRVGPSKNTAILATVKRATKVVVLEDQSGWYRVKLENGREGWVAASVTSSERP
jgi:curli biogenesis system outer membrane secretion channel CsgG